MTTSETRENMTTSSTPTSAVMNAPTSAPASAPNTRYTAQTAGEGMHIVAVDRFSLADRQMMQASVPAARFTWIAQKSEHLPVDATALVGNFPVTAVQELFAAQSQACAAQSQNSAAQSHSSAAQSPASTPRLQLIQLLSAGYDKYMNLALPQGVVIANASGAYDQAVSEHAFAQLLALMKNLDQYADLQREHRWQSAGEVRSLVGATVVVLGYGHIGEAFARLCTAMGAKVFGFRRNPAHSANSAAVTQVVAMDSLADYLPSADVVVSFLPSNPQTVGFFDESFFSAMKQGSYFVNAGRGDAVDSAALQASLRAGHLAGAALDVTNPEPLPADSSLWDTPRLIITPHVAGGWHLPQSVVNLRNLTMTNLTHLALGEPVENVVLPSSRA